MGRVSFKSMAIQYQIYSVGLMYNIKITTSDKEELDTEVGRYLREYPAPLYGTIVKETGYDAGKYYAFIERYKTSDR